MNKKLEKLLVYVYVPIIFTFISYGILALALSPFYEITASIFGLVVTNEQYIQGGSINSSYELTDIHDGLINLENLTLPVYGEHYAQLKIDAVGIETAVFYGDDYGILRRGAGQYSGSFFPGFKGTTLIAGHNTTFFRPLRSIEEGNIISLSTSYGNFEYRIYDVEIVHQSQYHLYLDLVQMDEDILLLYTCYPFDGLVGVAKERLFVYAEKVSGPTIVDGG